MKYYNAYDLRYQQAHKENIQWFSNEASPIVMEMLEKYAVAKSAKLLEIGCGEGRDAIALLKQGYDLLATDISAEAVHYCKSLAPDFAEQFSTFDCLADTLPQKFDFIYAVAVLHMLTEDEDRAKFFAGIKSHLKEGGLALVCTMGDGEDAWNTDPAKAFDMVQREHLSGKLLELASTSCRVVNWETLHKEVAASSLSIVEEGMCSAPPDFGTMMYVLIQ